MASRVCRTPLRMSLSLAEIASAFARKIAHTVQCPIEAGVCIRAAYARAGNRVGSSAIRFNYTGRDARIFTRQRHSDSAREHRFVGAGSRMIRARKKAQGKCRGKRTAHSVRPRGFQAAPLPWVRIAIIRKRLRFIA